MPIKPSTPKHTSDDLGDRLVISIPDVEKSRFLIFFLWFWLVFFVLLEVAGIGMLLFYRNWYYIPDDFFEMLVSMVVMLMLFCGFAIYRIAKDLTGKEVIEVTAQSITTGSVVLGMRSPKEYSANAIKGLRVSPSNMNLYFPMLFGTNSRMVGSVAFDYGAKTFRFGRTIEEGEAKQIIAEIQQKFPQYKN